MTAAFKQRAIEAIRELPDEADFDQLVERLYVLFRIERGLAQDEAGETVSQDEIEREFLS